MAYFPTNVLDNQIKALPTIASASGSIANFTTDKAENLVECEVQIVAVQSGSGTPSPTNPRAISGFSACNLSHSDADTSNPTVYNIPFGQTIYGGVLNVGTGVLRVTHGIFTDNGSLPWTKNADGSFFVWFADGSLASNTNDGMCNYCPYNVSFSGESCFVRSGNSTAVLATSWGSYYADATALKAQFTITPIQIIFPLATPTTIQLSATEIQTLIGENNIWSDTGDIIDLKFVLSVGKAIS